MTQFERRIIRLIFLLAAAMMFLLIWHAIAPKFKFQPPSTQVASALKTVSPLKEFSLIDSNGNQFNNKSLRGHWTVLFFGYTRCPDICPKTLAIVQETWRQFSNNNKVPARFIFADISSEAVPTAELKLFLNNYHPDFLGLSGSKPAMQKLSDQLGIYSKTEFGVIDHTAAMMLIDPQARLCAVFTPPFSAENLIHDLYVLTNQ